jgi:hypothetical protein
MLDVWKVLYQFGADIVVNGHDHDYERFAPQNPGGKPDPKGIREFVVGTAGEASTSSSLSGRTARCTTTRATA